MSMMQAICRTLIHSLWEGLLFAVLTGVALVCTSKTSAAMRYNIVSGLLLCLLGSITCTFLYEYGQAGPQTAPEISLQADRLNPFYSWVYGMKWIRGMNDYLTGHATGIVLVWIILLLARSMGMMSGLLHIRRIRKERLTPVSAWWEERLASLAGRLNIRKTIRLLESGMTRVPVVTGHLKPVICIPLGMLTQIPQGEVEAILLHELAHIRRHDYLVNLFQNIAENLFFFNPGLLWISAILRRERENCCDDIAIGQTNNRQQFVQALVSFKEYSLYGSSYATAFPSKRSLLFQRVMRIVNNRNHSLSRTERTFMILSSLILVCLLAFVKKMDSGHMTSIAKEDKRAHFFSDIHRRENEAIQATMYEGGKQLLPLVHEMAEATEPLKREKQREMSNADLLRARLRIEQLERDKQRTLKDRQRAGQEQLQMERDQEEAEREQRLQADRDKMEAELAAKQEERSKMQAMLLDAEQAAKDRKRAMEDENQAAIDRKQAMNDAIQAERDRKQAMTDAVQAEKDKKQALRDAEQAALNKERAAKDVIRARAEKEAIDKARSKTRGT